MVTSYEVYRSALDAYTAVYPSVAGVSWQKVATVPSTATSTTLTMPANQHQADLAVGVANDGAALLGYNFYVVAVNLTSSSTPSNVVSVITGFKGKSGEQLVCKDPHTNSGVFLIDLPETWGWPGEVDYIIPTTVSDLHGKSGTGAYQAPLSSLNVTVKSQTVKSHGNGAVLYTINTPDPIVPDATTKVCPS